MLMGHHLGHISLNNDAIDYLKDVTGSWAASLSIHAKSPHPVLGSLTDVEHFMRYYS